MFCLYHVQFSSRGWNVKGLKGYKHGQVRHMSAHLLTVLAPVKYQFVNVSNSAQALWRVLLDCLSLASLFYFASLGCPLRCHIHCRWRWWRSPRRLLCWTDSPPDWTSSPNGPRSRPRPLRNNQSRPREPAAGACRQTRRDGRAWEKCGRNKDKQAPFFWSLKNTLFQIFFLKFLVQSGFRVPPFFTSIQSAYFVCELRDVKAKNKKDLKRLWDNDIHNLQQPLPEINQGSFFCSEHEQSKR